MRLHDGIDGDLIYNAGVYDDLQGSAAALRLPASSAPTWETYDFGLGGIAFAVQNWQVGEYADVVFQTKHGMKLNTALNHHLHFTVNTNDTGKKIKFQLDGIAAGIGSPFSILTGSPFVSEKILSGDEANKHIYFDVADLPGINTTVSTLYILRLTRIAASSDDYTGKVYLLFGDSHFKRDRLGSIMESSQ